MVRQCCKLLCRHCNDTYLLLKSIIDWCFSVTTRALVLEISWNEYWCAFIYQNLGSFLYRSLYFNLYVKINLDIKETFVFYSLVLYHNSPLAATDMKGNDVKVFMFRYCLHSSVICNYIVVSCSEISGANFHIQDVDYIL